MHVTSSSIKIGEKHKRSFQPFNCDRELIHHRAIAATLISSLGVVDRLKTIRVRYQKSFLSGFVGQNRPIEKSDRISQGGHGYNEARARGGPLGLRSESGGPAEIKADNMVAHKIASAGNRPSNQKQASPSTRPGDRRNLRASATLPIHIQTALSMRMVM